MVKYIECDHKWGDGEDEYSKTRTLCVGEDSDIGIYRIEICDRCKAILLWSEKAYYEWSKIGSN